MKILGIDMGKDNLKSFDGKKSFTCISTFSEGVDKLDSGFQVLNNGHKYLVGDLTLGYDIDISKEKEQFRTLMYLAIFKLVNHGERVKVVVSCPVDVCLNRQAKRSYKEFLSKEKKIVLTVDGETKTFFIENLSVVAEGSGILYKNSERYCSEIIGVVDIGGSTTNCILANELNLVRNQSFSEMNGMHYLRAKIRDSLKKTGIIIGENEVKFLMRNPGEYTHLINKEINGYLSQIKKSLLARNWSETMPIIFTGGGSLELYRQIENKFPYSTVSTDALYDNCYGNYRIGVVLWEKSQE